MHYHPDDTIAAIGTATGGATRGMVRLSGPQILDCLESCFQPGDSQVRLSEIRTPSLISGSLFLAEVEQTCLPCDLLFWPSKSSYTRQPTAELHTLGSPPLLEKLLSTVCRCGARLAEPGEFTLRAFLAGRLDLTQAEAVLGVIDADSTADLHNALAQLAGGLSQPLTKLREQLLHLLAELEAGLDFVEEDIEFITFDQLRDQLSSAQATVDGTIAQLASREEASNLPRVVLAGPPNAGKSSLFNALVERYGAAQPSSPALVSEQSGTTRDYVTAMIVLNGLACELIDTAGLEPSSESGSMDQFAQEMTGQQHEQANLVLRCEDAGAEHDEYADLLENEIVARTKSDLQASPLTCQAFQVACSSVDGSGLNELTQQIYEKLTDSSQEKGNASALTATRCTDSLHRAKSSLSQALQIVEVRGGEELIAAEVRHALHSLGQVVGAIYTDDILDRIFGQFCIGK